MKRKPIPICPKKYSRNQLIKHWTKPITIGMDISRGMNTFIQWATKKLNIISMSPKCMRCNGISIVQQSDTKNQTHSIQNDKTIDFNCISHSKFECFFFHQNQVKNMLICVVCVVDKVEYTFYLATGTFISMHFSSAVEIQFSNFKQ